MIWILVVFGAANGVAYSKLTKDLRDLAARVSSFTGDMFRCVLCLGFWFGMLFSLWHSPTGFFLCDAFLGSASSWLIYLYIWDKQLSH